MAKREQLVVGELTIAGPHDIGVVIKGMFKFTAAWTPTNPGANTAAEQTVAVPGVQVGDIVTNVTPPGPYLHGSIGGSRVSAANTIAVTFIGDSVGGAPPSGNYIFYTMRTR